MRESLHKHPASGTTFAQMREARESNMCEKVIVTKQNADGTYDEVGMNNRAVLDYKNDNAIRKAASSYANGKPHRIEYFGSSIQGKPHKVVHVK